MTIEFDISALDDGRAQYPTLIRARAPIELHRDVKRAAAAEGLPLSEFVRRALTERVEAAGLEGRDYREGQVSSPSR